MVRLRHQLSRGNVKHSGARSSGADVDGTDEAFVSQPLHPAVTGVLNLVKPFGLTLVLARDVC
jgi:hypothetical protein